MFCDNLKSFRRAKGLSQEELAIKLSVVRQTVSKWENGLSVPDAQMLVSIAQTLDTTVNALLGENVSVDENSELKTLAVKLEVLNEQIAKKNERNRKIWRTVFVIIIVFAVVSFGFYFADFIYHRHTLETISGDIAIIGGADGPTNIYVSNVSFRLSNIILTLTAFVVSVVGIFKTRKK